VIILFLFRDEKVTELLFGASQSADSLLGDGRHSLAAKGFRLDLHNERARATLFALAVGTRVRSVFGVTLVGAHAHWLLAADGKGTVLDANANAWAQLALLRSFFDRPPVALGLQCLETAVSVGRAGVAAGTRLDGLVLNQRTDRMLGARLRQHHAIIVVAFAFLARMFRCGGDAICFRPSIRDGARHSRSLIGTRGEINFFWFVEDREIMVSVVGVDPARLKLQFVLEGGRVGIEEVEEEHCRRH